MQYTCFTNLDARFMRPYEPGDRLVRGWSGEISDLDPGGSPIAVAMLAELVFALHNCDDRPDGQMCPSMSIGDVVVFGEVALSVDTFGFKRVHVDPDDVITDRTWVEMISARTVDSFNIRREQT